MTATRALLRARASAGPLFTSVTSPHPMMPQRIILVEDREGEAPAEPRLQNAARQETRPPIAASELPRFACLAHFGGSRVAARLRALLSFHLLFAAQIFELLTRDRQ